MPRTDWTPRANGKFYGSPACCGAKFCTRADFDLATKRAAALAKRMGAGWEPDVWENLGWHYRVTNGIATVSERHEGKRVTYEAWLEVDHPTGKLQVIVDDEKTPEDALGTAVQQMRTIESRIRIGLAQLYD